jgi:hypothetical protein
MIRINPSRLPLRHCHPKRRHFKGAIGLFFDWPELSTLG